MNNNVNPKLRALGSIPRLKILMCLGDAPKSVNAIIDNCGLSQSAVSQHLAKLRAAGFLSCEDSGRERIYALTDPKLAEVSKYLFDLFIK